MWASCGTCVPQSDRLYLLAKPLAFGAAQLLSGLLFGVDPFRVGTFGGGALVLLLVGLAASFVPAYRAVRIDPMHALRQE